VGKKTHAKMLMIVRKEGRKLRRYVHLSTGNYHQGNTRIYTDYGLMTCDKAITQDVHEMFMQLTAQGPNPHLKKLVQSPFGINAMMVEKINREASNAVAGLAAKIILKVNGLSSPSIIDALYAASREGVQIELIVRGICCLRPGLPGISENIRVRSIVGRFLEHARVFYFENAEDAGDQDSSEVFLSSADLMPRNLRNRIEQCTPIEDKNLKARITTDLNTYLSSDRGAWLMQADGHYIQGSIIEATTSDATTPNDDNKAAKPDAPLDEQLNAPLQVNTLTAQQQLLYRLTESH
jgi:polyphosphate kinase